MDEVLISLIVPTRGRPRKMLSFLEGVRDHATSPQNIEIVMVVDDEEAVQDVVRRFLEIAGHHVTCVSSGEEAIAFLNQEGIFARAPQPDLVLLDLFLPKKDGLEVLADIRADFDLKDIPVVILTSSDADEDRSRCQLLHVDDYITKPVNLEKFLGVVKKLRYHWRSDVIIPTAK